MTSKKYFYPTFKREWLKKKTYPKNMNKVIVRGAFLKIQMLNGLFQTFEKEPLILLRANGYALSS